MSENNLAKLLDSLAEISVYVIEEETHRLLYFNRRCQEIGRGRAVLGVKCHEVWPEVCANCPLHGLGSGDSSHLVCFDPILKMTVDVAANRILWDGQIPAVVVTASPHRLNFEEEQGLQKIKQMYAQSLVTVFDECIIANLTTDYYVNCQKDILWTNIPEQGNFDVENRKYAAKAVHPDDLEEFLSLFSRDAMLRLFGKGKKQISKRLRRRFADGSYHMVEFTAARIERFGEDELWCVLVFRDVNEEYLLEQQRNIEIEQLAMAAGIAYQMLIAVNLTQNTYHMLGYERYPVPKPGDSGCFDDLIMAELSTVHPDYRDEFIQKFSRRALTEAFTHGKRILTMEVPHLGEDGEYHWHFTQVVWVETPHTDDLIEVTLSRNIDGERLQQQEALEKERKAKALLEEALEKAEQASRAKNDFLSRMSHDIRTPMNAIVGMTELAQQHLGEEEKLRDYLKKVASSSMHLLSLINEVLDVSKIESGTFKLEESEFDLRSLVQEAAEMIRLSLETKNQEFSIVFAENLHSRVLGDNRRLKQVLVNILENASKYTGEGGKISLSLEELDEGERQVGTYRFVMEDNGIGMKPEFLQHIFEPFSRADDSRISKITGTGLGMTIVQNLVSMMGGDIQVQSEYGKGSRFQITLCLLKSYAKTKAPAEAKPAGADYTEIQTLLVEDNELNRQIATEMLELLGAKVDTAENGKLAVDAICSHPPFYYDIVFMDVQMPVMNGYDAAKEIRALPMEGIGELPVIALTADAFAEDAKRARLAGMNGHLAKPISISQLKNALSRTLEWKLHHGRGEMPEGGGENLWPGG